MSEPALTSLTILFHFHQLGAMSEIKVLDAQKWFSGNAQERQEFAQSLLEGFQTAGFVKLVNHGLSDKCIDEAFEWVSVPVKPLRQLLSRLQI
jgi:hypothetical protein